MNLRSFCNSALLLAASASSTVCATDYLVNGKVLDGHGQPNIGIAVHIYQPSDSVATSVFSSTDTEGLFSLPAKKPGDYELALDGVGYRKTIMPFVISEPVTDLPDIVLAQDTELLEEVVVEARKPLIQSDGATMTYNVDEDPSSSTSTTIEILRKVPMVSVDAEDNIKVNGQSNFKIYVNGKEDPMMSADSKSVLRSLPASTIRKIEVLTEPGAKYEAEGVGGILNIVTVNNSTIEGYLANLNAMVTNQYWSISGYGQTKINKVTASANVGYFDTSINRSRYHQNNYVEYFNNPQLALTLMTAKTNPVRNKNINGSLNLSWEPDTLNLVTLSGYLGSYANKLDAPLYISAFSPLGEPSYSYTSDYSKSYNTIWGGMTLSMQHNFSRPEHNVTFSYDLNLGSSKETDLRGYMDMAGVYFENPWQKYHSSSPNAKHTLQLDYTLPLRKDNDTFEAGAKAIWKPSDSDKEEYIGSDRDYLAPNEKNHINLRQINDVLAAYVSYNAKFDKLTLKAGLRYEHTRLGYRYKVGNYPDFTSRLNDLIPNAAVAWNFGGSSNLRLAYQMRVSRPDVSQMNPYINEFAYNMCSVGNPDLKSSKSNSVNLSYSQYGMKLGGSIRVGYGQDDDAVSYYQFMRDGIIYSSYANIGHEKTFSIGGNLNWTIIKDMRLGVSVSGLYTDCFARMETKTVSNSGWNGNFNANIDYTTPFKLRISAYGGFGTPWISLQGKGSKWNYFTLSFSRSFLPEDRLTLSLNASNFIQPKTTWVNETITESFKSVNSGSMSQWTVGLNISWRLGSLSTSVKSTANRLEGTSQGNGNGNGGSNQSPGL